MSRLDKKLDELSSLLKQFNARIKMPGMSKPSTPKAPSMPKMPGVAPKSQKDPVKIAEQISNPDTKDMVMDQARSIKESTKISKNGQWSMVKAEETPKKGPLTTKLQPDSNIDIIAPKEFSGAYNKRPEQKRLLEGIDFNTKKDKLNDEQLSGMSKGTGWHKSKAHSHNVLIKPSTGHPDLIERGHDELSSARREVLFHNLAHDFFGMGKHVPTTAGFIRGNTENSAQKEVRDGRHVPRSLADPGSDKMQLPKDYTDTLKNLHESGELHKMAMMDHIMGHHDRHRGNFMYTPGDKDKLHLIDNGTAFDYINFDVRESPHYWDHAISNSIKDAGHKDELHPKAKDWLMKLDPKKAMKIIEEHEGYQSDKHARGLATRLKHMKELVKSGEYKGFKDLLKQNKYSTGPSWHEKDKKDVA